MIKYKIYKFSVINYFLLQNIFLQGCKTPTSQLLKIKNLV